MVLRGPRTGGPALLHGEGSRQYVTCDGVVFIVRGEEETPSESLSASLGKEHDDCITSICTCTCVHVILWLWTVSKG